MRFLIVDDDFDSRRLRKKRRILSLASPFLRSHTNALHSSYS